MDFLALALQASFLPIAVFPPPVLAVGAPGYVVRSGEGEPGKSGDLVTVEFCVQSWDGKELANSEKRGMPQTFVLSKPGGDDLLSAATLGARLGEIRQMVLMKEDWYSNIGPFRLIQEPGPVIVRISVTQISRR